MMILSILLYALSFFCLAYGILLLYRTSELNYMTSLMFWALTVFIACFLFSGGEMVFPTWLLLCWVVLEAALLIYSAVFYLSIRKMMKKYADTKCPGFPMKTFLVVELLFSLAPLFCWMGFCLMPIIH